MVQFVALEFGKPVALPWANKMSALAAFTIAEMLVPIGHGTPQVLLDLNAAETRYAGPKRGPRIRASRLAARRHKASRLRPVPRNHEVTSSLASRRSALSAGPHQRSFPTTSATKPSFVLLSFRTVPEQRRAHTLQPPSTRSARCQVGLPAHRRQVRLVPACAGQKIVDGPGQHG